MNHRLTLEIPDKVYEPLLRKAKQAGRTPEELVIEWVDAWMQRSEEDPVERFIGALNTGITGWADHHDEYIGREL